MRLDWQAAPAVLAPGTRLYAIGDIHGCAARLRELHAMVASDLAARPIARAVLVHLGDSVDKGGDPRGVLDALLALEMPGAEVVNLRGNHEALMRDALDGVPGAAADWLWCGGEHTLVSYGTNGKAGREAWAAAIPPTHLALLRDGLALHHREGPYLCVHAGIRPGVALPAQSEDDLLTIRGDFLHATMMHEAVVVHGHTARLAPEVKPNRVNLDTAAFCGGALTCGVFEADRLAFLTA